MTKYFKNSIVGICFAIAVLLLTIISGCSSGQETAGQEIIIKEKKTTVQGPVINDSIRAKGVPELSDSIVVGFKITADGDTAAAVSYNKVNKTFCYKIKPPAFEHKYMDTSKVKLISEPVDYKKLAKEIDKRKDKAEPTFLSKIGLITILLIGGAVAGLIIYLILKVKKVF